MRQLNRILIVNPFGIGDVLFTTPFIAALKEKFPAVSISYIGNARTSPFLKNDPRIDKVFSYERDEYVEVYRKSPWQFLFKWKKLVDDIRAEKVDVAFDLSLGSPLGVALAWAGIPERIGYDYKGRGRWLTRKVPLRGYEGRPVAEYYLDLLEEIGAGSREPGAKSSIAATAPCRKTFLCVSQADSDWAAAFLKAHHLEPRKFIVIYPGGGASWGKTAVLKRWPLENHAKLADKIFEKTSLAVILLGDRDEKKLCETVKNAMRHPALNAAGETSVARAAALMQSARFVIANDGGPLHIAVASGVRTISIFGPVDENVYGPFPREDHIIAVKSLPCRPCYRNFRMSDCRHLSCLRQLTVDEVYSTLEEHL